MINFIPLFTIFILILFSQNCKAQVYEEPPKMAVSRDENKPLIDKIIVITNYERYFKNYCVDFISKTAKQEKWAKEKSERVKAKINFTEFKVQNLHNWLVNYSTKDLNEFFELYKKDKGRDANNIIIDNQNITKHLEWYAQRLIQN